MMYSKYLDGRYTGKQTYYIGEFDHPFPTFTIYKDAEWLCTLSTVATLNKHYTNPEMMPYYNLASQLIKEGEVG